MLNIGAEIVDAGGRKLIPGLIEYVWDGKALGRWGRGAAGVWRVLQLRRYVQWTRSHHRRRWYAPQSLLARLNPSASVDSDTVHA